MQQELSELSDLPLSFIIAAPLNAAIEAQKSAAMTTAEFVEQVGFEPKKKRPSLFTDEGNEHRIRLASVNYEQDVVKLETPGTPATGTSPGTSAVYEVVKDKRTLSVPFLSLVNIPNFEVSELSVDFSVRLRGVTQLDADFNEELTGSTESASSFDIGNGGKSLRAGLGALGFPLHVGASMKVQVTSRTQIGVTYTEGHEAQYDLRIAVKAVQAPQPKGVERLLALAERVVDASAAARAERDRLNALPPPE